MLDFIGGLISSGMKLFGGETAQKAQEKINQENIAQQNLVNQNRIQWTVADANKAGINPLAALGNATQSYSNVAGSSALGDSIGSAGQDIGRAVAALAPVKLRNAELENKLLEAKIRNFDSDTVANMKNNSDVAKTLGQPGTPPGVPLPQPHPWIELTQKARTKDGRIIDIPSEKAASPLQTLGALPTNLGMAMQDFLAPIIDTGNRLHEASPSWDALYGQAKRAVQDFGSAVYNRNNSGY